MAVTSLRAALTTVMNFINTFVATTNNPTGVTAAQAGTYTKTELDNLLAKKMAYGDIPIAYWGQSLDYLISLSTANGNLTIGAGVPALLAGVRQVMGAATIAMPATGGAPNYLYLTVSNGVLAYSLRATQSAESSTLMYLATVSTLGVGDWSPVIQIGGKRLSKTRKGNAIPVSDSTGGLGW